jgi:hypothetical protein
MSSDKGTSTLPTLTKSRRDAVASLLGAPREIGAVLSRTLSREMNARVAADLERAMLLTLPTGEMCVTAAGEWVVAGQLIAAGGHPVSEEGAGLLAFKREMRELELRMVGLEADLVFADEAAQSRARWASLRTPSCSSTTR